MKSDGENKGCTFTFTMAMDIVSFSELKNEKISIVESIRSRLNPTALQS